MKPLNGQALRSEPTADVERQKGLNNMSKASNVKRGADSQQRRVRTSDCEYMPRRIKAEWCCAMDDDGNRCKSKATIEAYYHGDRESNTTQACWVRVALCDSHAGSININDANS